MKDWNELLKPLLFKYKDTKHPLMYNNLYELLVMVVLSAQDSDANINKVAPLFFNDFPTLKSLVGIDSDVINSYFLKVRNNRIKTNYIINIVEAIKTDENIPQKLDELIKLNGIGRKSANVILREIGKEPEGIIVDLHVIRVAPRLGVVSEKVDGNKIEKQLMQAISKEMWNVGMAISFLGREICRPKNPKCGDCLLNEVCDFYKNSDLNL
ncbi:MAG: endonuclease III [Cytophagaceae bacterium]|nr:endonuclease III [Cytophagaceae bacterium]